MKKFERDLNRLLTRLKDDVDECVKRELDGLKNRLIHLHEKNVVKINHSVMELICAKHLILRGYETKVEHPLSNGLTCDLYGEKGYGNLIVEIETGFIPPKHALRPAIYSTARIASKIARYSNYANKFALGAPPHYVMQIPLTLTKPPRVRRIEELQAVKNRCDTYYKNPTVSIDEIRYARLHEIHIINVDEATVLDIDPTAYIENTTYWKNWSKQ